MKYYINQSGDTVIKENYTVIKECGKLQVIDSENCNVYQLSLNAFFEINQHEKFHECDKTRYLAIRDRFIKSLL